MRKSKTLMQSGIEIKLEKLKKKISLSILMLLGYPKTNPLLQKEFSHWYLVLQNYFLFIFTNCIFGFKKCVINILYILRFQSLFPISRTEFSLQECLVYFQIFSIFHYFFFHFSLFFQILTIFSILHYLFFQFCTIFQFFTILFNFLLFFSILHYFLFNFPLFFQFFTIFEIFHYFFSIFHYLF